MSLTIFYTPRSKETLCSVYDFTSNKFGAGVTKKFAINAEKTILLIAEHPFMFKASEIDINVRIALIKKQTSLFYRVTDFHPSFIFLG